MDVSAYTLDMLDAAVVSTLPEASPAEQGQLLADLIRWYDVKPTPTPTPKPAPEAQAQAPGQVAMPSVADSRSYER